MVKWVTALAALMAAQQLSTIQHHSPIFEVSAFSTTPHRAGFALSDSLFDPSIVISLRAGTPPRLVPSPHFNKSRNKVPDSTIIEALAISSDDFSEYIDNSPDDITPYFASESVEIPDSPPEYTPFDDIVASLASDAHRRFNERSGNPPPKAPAPLPPPSPKQKELAKYRQGLVKVPFPVTNNVKDADENDFSSMEWIDGRPDDDLPKQPQKVRYQANLPKQNYHESSAYQSMDWLSGPGGGKKAIPKVRYQANQSNGAKSQSKRKLPAMDTKAYNRDAYIAKSTNSKIGWTSDRSDSSKHVKRIRSDMLIQKPGAFVEQKNDGPMDWIDGPERGKRVIQKVRFQMKTDNHSKELDQTQKNDVMDWVDGPEVSKRIQKKVRYELDIKVDDRNNQQPNQNNALSWDGGTNMNEMKDRERNKQKVDVLRGKLNNIQKQENVNKNKKNIEKRQNLGQTIRPHPKKINNEKDNVRRTTTEVNASHEKQVNSEANSVMEWVDGPEVTKRIQKKVRYELDIKVDNRNNQQPNQNNGVSWADTNGSTNMNEMRDREKNKQKVDVLREKFYNAQKQMENENTDVRKTITEVNIAHTKQENTDTHSEKTVTELNNDIKKAGKLENVNQIEKTIQAPKKVEETSMPQPAQINGNEKASRTKQERKTVEDVDPEINELKSQGNSASNTPTMTSPKPRDQVSPKSQEVAENKEVIEGLKDNINSVLDKFDETGIEGLESDINTVLDKFDDTTLDNSVLHDEKEETIEVSKPEPEPKPETEATNLIASLYQLAARKQPGNKSRRSKQRSRKVTATARSAEKSESIVDPEKEIVQSRKQTVVETKPNLDTGDSLDTLISNENHREAMEKKIESKSHIPTKVKEPNNVVKRSNIFDVVMTKSDLRSNEQKIANTKMISQQDQQQQHELPSSDDTIVFQTKEEDTKLLPSSDHTKAFQIKEEEIVNAANKSELVINKNDLRYSEQQTDDSKRISQQQQQQQQQQHNPMPSTDFTKVVLTKEEEILSVLSSTSNILMEVEQYRQDTKKKKSGYKGFDKILDTQAKVEIEFQEYSSTVKTYLDKLKKSELELSKIKVILTKSIDSTNEEISAEEAKILTLINFQSTLEQPDSKILSAVQTLLQQYEGVTNIKKRYVEILNISRKEIESISVEYEDRRIDLEQTYETLERRDTPRNMQLQWSLLDSLKRQLNDHEEKIPFFDERIKVTNEQIIKAIVMKLGSLGESLPECISMLSTPSPIKLMSHREERQAEFEIRMYEPEKPIVKLKDLENASDDEILLTISKSAATAAVAGGKTLMFGLKALIDAATKDDVRKATNSALEKSSSAAKNIYGMSNKSSTLMALPPSKEAIKSNLSNIKNFVATEEVESTLKSTGETFEALGQAGKAIVNNLPDTENSWMTSKAAKDAGKNLMSTFNALLVLGTRQVSKMTNETLAEY